MKSLYGWTRDLHLYAGVFLSPAVLIFAVSTLLLNHQRPPSDADGHGPLLRAGVPVEVSGETGTLEQAKGILRQLNLTGEINFVRHLPRQQSLVIPVLKPGEATWVEVDLRTRTAKVERQIQGLGAALIYLHKMPGPHLVQFRGNWVYTVVWGVLADAVVWGLLFLTISGVYLWYVLKTARQTGLLLLASGGVSLALLVIALALPGRL
jgi:hypothetical protein